MFCSSCGAAVSQQLKYCNRCGSQLSSTDQSSAVEATEKRLHEEGTDLFWVTVIGLGIILGGMFVMKRALQLSESLILAFLILSSSAFAINILLSLWQIRRLARISKEARTAQIEPGRPGELPSRPTTMDSLPSVTEHTTRTLEPVSKQETH